MVNHRVLVIGIRFSAWLDYEALCFPSILWDFQEGDRNLEAKIEQLLNVEKQMRLAGDVAGTKKAATDILQLCFEAQAWKTLNEQIVVLSKRRGQLKQVPFWNILEFVWIWVLEE